MEPTTDRNGSFFRFEDLRIYTKATDYSVWLSANLHEVSNLSQQRLEDAFLRASYNISLNIAEGSSRNKAQFEHYLKISKTAIRECVVFTTMAGQMGLLSADQVEDSRQTLMEMTRMVGALIISLQRGKSRRDEDDARMDYPQDDSLDDIANIDTDF